ncbi:transglycosylase SLT domain-containing protein [Clostridium tetani]|uniref:Lytic transglycosylase domain-containing protein n=1 Tax=Clostridium tetani TaxID=1513 RepID=A0ABY0ERY2_CLOTA|nr:transglycosylase SLT domain-containing protein [Clostridium tetani]CDI50590.1 soluble lytic murein transglycosylase [Clostridium tetani 12124569]KHO32386.1 lytic transglycosylase [Clostridium tetani]QBD85723.1 lytic transglycosylase domain-containing protein [Clostridium tetani]QBD88078.1 lytic transglycosylase domain-containing protein [Clostridium tetani]RXI58071.1 lytic transglycosylase domain-containing protein [Clostridium tetani]
MNVDENKKIEQLLQMQLMTQIFKSAGKDSSAFALVLESISKEINKDNKEILQGLEIENKEQFIKEVANLKSDLKSPNKKIDEAVEKAARRFNIDKDLILSVIKQESSFQTDCVSSAGAMGLMQLMPGTAKYLGVSNPYDIEQNINGGTKYLKEMLNMYGNSKELALAAYNSGPGTMQKRGVKSVGDIERLPYETRDYVKKVMNYYGKK